MLLYGGLVTLVVTARKSNPNVFFGKWEKPQRAWSTPKIDQTCHIPISWTLLESYIALMYITFKTYTRGPNRRWVMPHGPSDVWEIIHDIKKIQIHYLLFSNFMADQELPKKRTAITMLDIKS